MKTTRRTPDAEPGAARPVPAAGAAGRSLLHAWRADFRCCATDVDGTLTLEDPGTPDAARGSLHPDALAQIRRLTLKRIPVVLVTGRPLPTVEGLAMYLGLTDRNLTQCGFALIAENGAVAKWDGAVHRLRLCDVGIHTPPELLPLVRGYFQKRPELGLQAVTSNIMSHVMCARASKARALEWVMKRMDLAPENIVVFGDSDTDIPLFERFPRSVAVSNYFGPQRSPALAALPAVAASKPGGAGFAETVARLV